MRITTSPIFLLWSSFLWISGCGTGLIAPGTSGSDGTEYLDLANIAIETDVLPYGSGWGAARVIGEYVYLFGGTGPGWGGANHADHVFRAPVSDPTNFTDLGRPIPQRFAWAPVIETDTHVYAIGSVFGVFNAIHRAPKTDLTDWSDTGVAFPTGIVRGYYWKEIEGYTYIFGGDMDDTKTEIWRAPSSDLTDWADTGFTLPSSGYGGGWASWEDHILFFAGAGKVYRAQLSDLSTWDELGNHGIHTDSGASLVIGNRVYFLGAHDHLSIYSAPVLDPTNWRQEAHDLPMNRWGADHIIRVGDTVYVYGGCGADYKGRTSIISIPIVGAD